MPPLFIEVSVQSRKERSNVYLC